MHRQGRTPSLGCALVLRPAAAAAPPGAHAVTRLACFPCPLPPPPQVSSEQAAARKAEAAREREEAAIQGFEQAVEARRADVEHVDAEIAVVQQRLGELQDLRALVRAVGRGGASCLGDPAPRAVQQRAEAAGGGGGAWRDAAAPAPCWRTLWAQPTH